MKIVRPTEVTVTFENAQEAARYLYAYYAGAGIERLGFPILSSDAAEASAIRIAAARGAVQLLANGFGVDVPAADAQHAEPTYISCSSDRVCVIAKMPTRYIRNVLAMGAHQQVAGLEKVLYAELRRRGERP